MYRETYEGGKWKYPFILYRPNCCTGKLPLVIQLHGAGERGCGGDELTITERYGFSKLMTPEANYPCLLVIPQCQSDAFWSTEISHVYELLQQVKEEWDIDETRIYLAGISMGAYATWLAAARYPQLFAAIAPVCGGGMIWTADLLKIPIWAFHGTDDSVVPFEESLNMIRAVRSYAEPEQDVRFTAFDGVNHNAWDYTFDESLLQWLLSKHK